MKIEIDRATQKVVDKKLKLRGLTPTEFLAWKQTVEFEIGDEPGKHLQSVRDGADSFYEYRLTMASGGREFRVTWEIDWDKSSGRFFLLEIHITPMQPNLYS